MLYDEFRHDGAHIVHMKFVTNKERDLFTRLMNEAIYSLNLGLYSSDQLAPSLTFYKGLTYRIESYDEEEGLINCRCQMNGNVIIPLPIEVEIEKFSNPLVIYGVRYLLK
jgi:hypothetical protein